MIANDAVTLHGHASKDDPFHLGCGSAIFAHPTLRELTLTDATIEMDLRLSDVPPCRLKSTPLQSLTFLECHVYIAALDVILCFPTWLRKLSVDEVRYHDGRIHTYPPFRLQSTTAHPDFVRVLRRVAPTLEELVHNCGRLLPEWSSVNNIEANIWGSSSPLITFPFLKRLEMSANSILLSQVIECPELSVWRINNSNLLYGSHANRGTELLIDTLELCRHLLNQARVLILNHKPLRQPLTLDVVYNYSVRPLVRCRHWWVDDDRPWVRMNRLRVYEIATVLKARGSRFRIFGETLGRIGIEFAPPFLHGEPRPREVCLYDSARLWEIVREDWQTRDRELVPPHLRSTCSACTVAEAFCVNNGYGTQCERCIESDTSCDYTDRPALPQEQGFP